MRKAVSLVGAMLLEKGTGALSQLVSSVLCIGVSSALQSVTCRMRIRGKMRTTQVLLIYLYTERPDTTNLASILRLIRNNIRKAKTRNIKEAAIRKIKTTVCDEANYNSRAFRTTPKLGARGRSSCERGLFLRRSV